MKLFNLIYKNTSTLKPYFIRSLSSSSNLPIGSLRPKNISFMNIISNITSEINYTIADGEAIRINNFVIRHYCYKFVYLFSHYVNNFIILCNIRRVRVNLLEMSPLL